MKTGQRLWTREELLLVLNLYCKIPFGKAHGRNPEVIELAKLIKRTPGSIAFKLGNFGSLDPALKARGIVGVSHVGQLDKEIWNDFFAHLDVRSFESEKKLADLKNTSIEEKFEIYESELPREGKVREQMVKVRVNQGFFRSMVLSSYNKTCCITGIQQPKLLVASHIRPWNLDIPNRMNPRNGLALNALHDRAYETGLMSITPDYKIEISSVLKKETSQAIENHFLRYQGRSITLPSRFLPDKDFLRYHYEERFVR